MWYTSNPFNKPINGTALESNHSSRAIQAWRFDMVSEWFQRSPNLGHVHQIPCHLTFVMCMLYNGMIFLYSGFFVLIYPTLWQILHLTIHIHIHDCICVMFSCHIYDMQGLHIFILVRTSSCMAVEECIADGGHCPLPVCCVFLVHLCLGQGLLMSV